MAFIETPFGSITFFADMEYVKFGATNDQLWKWANRPGYRWPCSTLADCEYIAGEFSADGLVDISHPGIREIDSNEFNAWSSDLLRDVLPTSHPAYEITVGQFDRKNER